MIAGLSPQMRGLRGDDDRQPERNDRRALMSASSNSPFVPDGPTLARGLAAMPAADARAILNGLSPDTTRSRSAPPAGLVATTDEECARRHPLGRRSGRGSSGSTPGEPALGMVRVNGRSLYGELRPLVPRVAAHGKSGSQGVGFRVLGPLEVVVDGQAVALGSPKVRLLLAALLAVNTNTVVSSDRLVETLSGSGHRRAH